MALPGIIPASNKVPGIYIEVLFGVGTRSALDAARKVMLYGNKSSAGTATVGVGVAVPSEDDALVMFGAGSELYLMSLAAFAANSGVTLYATPVTESAGANATATVTFAGTVTAAGSDSVKVRGEEIVTPVAAGDTATARALAMSNAIAARFDMPVTTSPAAGVLTLTALHKGPRGNHISLRASTTATGGTATASAAYLSGGTTSDDPATALDNNSPNTYRYHVAPYDDSTQLAKFKTHVDTYAGPLFGKRQVFIGASQASLGSAQTVANALQAKRGQYVWHFNADDTPAMLAAAMASTRAFWEAIDPGYNTIGKPLAGIKAQAVDADRPLNSEKDSALNAGVTPLRVDQNTGVVSIERNITTYFKSGSLLDYSVLDVGKVDVPDFIADDLEVKFAATFTGFKIGNDPSDASVAPPEGVVSPKMARDWCFAELKEYERLTYIENVEANKANLIFERATAPTTRLLGSIPVDVQDILAQTALQVRQVG